MPLVHRITVGPEARLAASLLRGLTDPDDLVPRGNTAKERPGTSSPDELREIGSIRTQKETRERELRRAWNGAPPLLPPGDALPSAVEQGSKGLLGEAHRHPAFVRQGGQEGLSIEDTHPGWDPLPKKGSKSSPAESEGLL